MIEAKAGGAGGNGAMLVGVASLHVQISVAICLTGGVGRPEPKVVGCGTHPHFAVGQERDPFAWDQQPMLLGAFEVCMAVDRAAVLAGRGVELDPNPELSVSALRVNCPNEADNAGALILGNCDPVAELDVFVATTSYCR